ncbi:F-box domain-containing protein [Mycena kentingensis (nom. inval.)]|nr:F-box domain-containing protein [Mycena kentingensis (nom. inval.)]
MLNEVIHIHQRVTRLPHALRPNREQRPLRIAARQRPIRVVAEVPSLSVSARRHARASGTFSPFPTSATVPTSDQQHTLSVSQSLATAMHIFRARTASTPTNPSKSSKSKSQPPLILPPASLQASGRSSGRPPLALGVVDEFGLATTETSSGYGAVGFLPTMLPADLHTPFASTSAPSLSASHGAVPHGMNPPPRAPYGLLSPARDTVLGLPDAARLVATVCAALERTSVATPFVFSSLALDARRAGVVRLTHAFLQSNDNAFAYEAQFAGAHELALCLRWGLSRVVRVEGGRELRGLLSWAWYERWKAEEAANAYPPTAFSTFIDSLPAQLGPILRPLFALCTKLVAHSSTSGHTPPSLAAILSPLLFGLSPPPLANLPATSYPTPTSPTGKKDKKDKGSDKDKDDPESLLFPTVEDFSTFGAVYEEYLRGARAAEHLLLACIREDVSGGLSGPTRLREWVGMYPASVDTGVTPAQGQRVAGARRGAKTVRIIHVRRNVRSYSTDLVKTGSSWAESTGPGTTNDWSSSRAWRTIIAGGAGSPRYTDSYRKRMDFGVGVHPSTSSLASSTSSTFSTALSTPSTALTSPSTTSLASSTGGGGETSFRSLTDMQWGAFESLGFGHGGGTGVGGFEISATGEKGGGIEGRLKFDLTENARAERAAKRETLSWSDFSAAGFSRSDAPLSATLQFSPPLTLSLGSTTANTPLNAELTRKLRKAHKALPAFGWDTSPVVGSEEVIEEAFLDVFCDLLYGGGWMERATGVGGPNAELAKECSWALVDYKSRSGGQQDPGATLVLYEEFVPREYRLALAGVAPPGTRRRLPSFFTPSTVPGGGKTWKQAPTLNGRPYVLGATPIVTGSTRDLDFDSMLKAQNGTKVISLGSPARRQPASRPPDPPPPGAALPLTRRHSDDSTDSAGGTPNASKRQSARFRLPGGMIPGPSPGNGPRVRPGMAPAESAPVDFQTRLAAANGSDSDDDEAEAAKVERQRRRESASDAWVDILVGSVQARRMGGQDAVMPTRGSNRRRGGVISPDVDIASMEVAQALAAETMGRGSLDVEDFVPHAHHQDQHQRDSDVVEVERVPRRSEQTDRLAYDTEEDDSVAYGDRTEDEEDSLTPGAEIHPALAQARQAKRGGGGYFDKHPDRRPVSEASVSTMDDDPRSLLGGDDSDDESDPILPTPRNLDSVVRPLPNSAEREQTPVGNGNGNGHAAASPIASPKPSQPTKTSALIDMFREREQAGQAGRAKPAGPQPQPIPPSRLPVRTAGASLPATPKPDSAPAPVVTPPEKENKSSPPLLDPPKIPAIEGEGGRASPGRYVHGAPLHNVLEEEEED